MSETAAGVALLRRRHSDELNQLAEEHANHDLEADDREILKSAAQKVSVWTTVGTGVGMGLGLYMAFRLRTHRRAIFAAFRAAEKPTKVVFGDGRTGALSFFFFLSFFIKRETMIQWLINKWS